MDTSTISIISIFIAAFSAIVSLLNFISNRAVLIKFGDNDNQPMPIVKGELKAYANDVKKDKPVEFPDGILFHLQILNPSPKDIAYFHMGFFSDDKPTNVWTKKSFGYLSDNPKIVMFDPIKGNGEITIPNAPQGIFKSHSFTPIYAFMAIGDSPFPQKVNFQFKYSVKKFPFIGKRSYYKTFSIDLNLTNVEKMLQSKQKSMMQLTQQEKQPLSSKQTPPYSKRRKHNRRKK